MKEPLIEEYVEEVMDHLNDKTEKEKKTHAQEIKEELYQIAKEKHEAGTAWEAAVEEAVAGIGTPKELALDLQHDSPVADFSFKMAVNALGVGFGLVIAVIFIGELAPGRTALPIMIIAGVSIWLFGINKTWSDGRLKLLHQLQPLMLFLFLPLGAAAFLLRSILDGAPNLTSFAVFILYGIAVLLIYVNVRDKLNRLYLR
ncbi:hypothetical protein [Alkalicoccus chagannorensis]|uniref:hypothetical protein n=1 Tax=Alkalicoccus chagannorensis TaxID=427072 RepID=UPI000429511A|nr:hypothetical protein [Alkalicoccus chagannorensis]